VSWRPTSRLRIGEQAAATKYRGIGELGPWYVSVFGTVFLRENATSLRFELRHYESSTDVKYQRYHAYLYQRLGSRSFVRAGYRFYDDDQGLQSHAWGLKLRHFFSPRFGAQAGYRDYDHSEGADFGTFLAAFDVIL
jgi:hypothetical protein